MSDLVHISQPGQVVPYNPNLSTGLDEAAITIKPSYIRLIQPMTEDKKGAKPGQFVDSLTGAIYDKIPVVPIRVSRNRVIYPEGAPFGTPALCRSSDGINPSPMIEKPQSTRCGYFSQGRFVAVCPNAKWGPKVNGKSKRPACDEKFRLLAVLKDTQLPRIFNFGGISFTPTQDLLRALKEDIFAEKSRGVNRDLYSYYFTITSAKKGQNFMVQFEGINRLTDPMEFGPLFQQYVYSNAPEDEEGDGNGAVDEAIAEVVHTAVEV